MSVIKAYFLARKVHKGQKDKSGKAYINHPLTVCKKVKGKVEKQVALLHDVIEDTFVTAEYLKEKGFSDAVVVAVTLLTKVEGEDYFEYLKRIKENPVARAVKIADLEHNSDLTRLKVVTDKDLARVEKYKKALEFLKS